MRTSRLTVFIFLVCAFASSVWSQSTEEVTIPAAVTEAATEAPTQAAQQTNQNTQADTENPTPAPGPAKTDEPITKGDEPTKPDVPIVTGETSTTEKPTTESEGSTTRRPIEPFSMNSTYREWDLECDDDNVNTTQFCTYNLTLPVMDTSFLDQITTGFTTDYVDLNTTKEGVKRADKHLKSQSETINVTTADIRTQLRTVTEKINELNKKLEALENKLQGYQSDNTKLADKIRIIITQNPCYGDCEPHPVTTQGPTTELILSTESALTEESAPSEKPAPSENEGTEAPVPTQPEQSEEPTITTGSPDASENPSATKAGGGVGPHAIEEFDDVDDIPVNEEASEAAGDIIFVINKCAANEELFRRTIEIVKEVMARSERSATHLYHIDDDGSTSLEEWKQVDDVERTLNAVTPTQCTPHLATVFKTLNDFTRNRYTTKNGQLSRVVYITQRGPAEEQVTSDWQQLVSKEDFVFGCIGLESGEDEDNDWQFGRLANMCTFLVVTSDHGEAINQLTTFALKKMP